MRLPVPEWRQSVHAEVEVSCDACHGGDPREEDADLSMSEQAGFLDGPAWTELADYCGVCHEAIAQSFDAGRFGRAMSRGQRVPTCATCHMANGHRILAAVPADLLTDERCPHCTAVEDPAGALETLARVREAELGVLALVAAVERKGIDLTDVRRESERVRDRWADAVHSFDRMRVIEGRSETMARLRDLATVADGFGREADDRRRFGLIALAALAVLLVALLRYRMLLANESGVESAG